MPVTGCIRLFGVLVLFFAIVRAVGADARQPPDVLWVSNAQGALTLGHSAGATVFQIPASNGFNAFAVDSANDTLWAYGREGLVAYDFTGQPKVSSVESVGNERPVTLAVNATDGSVWLGTAQTLHHFDAQGEKMGSINVDPTIRSIGIVPGRNEIWVATNRRVAAFNSSGQSVKEISPAQAGQISSLAYDASLDAIWITDRHHRVFRHSAESGVLQAEKRLALQPRLIAPDQAGGLWLASGSTLVLIDANGTEIRKLDLGTKSAITALLPDPAASGVWVATARALRYVRVNGEVQQQLPSATSLQKLAIRALALPTDESKQGLALRSRNGVGTGGVLGTSGNDLSNIAGSLTSGAAKLLSAGSAQAPVAQLRLLPAAAPAASVTYTYDSLGRLTQASFSNGAQKTYGYDAAGNRTGTSD